MTLRIYGTPVAQGSMKGFVVKGRAILTANNAGRLKPWRQEIANAAITAGATPMDGPVALSLTFYLRRPPSRARKYGAADKRPDLDKLVRSVLDALTTICWHDDAQVVALHAAKRYATNDEPEGILIETPTPTTAAR
jgi:crossover junction endodeoxyribonuclease RusA